MSSSTEAAWESRLKLEQRVQQYEDALVYISSPTMGLPGGRDAIDFVDEATEENVRLALKTCIRVARQGLKKA